MKQLGTPRLRLTAVAAALALTAAGTIGASAAPSSPGSNSPQTNSDSARTTGVDQSSAIVQLSRAPLATSSATAPGQAKKIDFDSTTVKNERAQLAAQRNELRQWLRSNAPKAQITGEYDVALNAVAVRLGGTPLSTLNGGPNVVSTGYESTYAPTAVSDPDLSLIDAQLGWAQANPGAPTKAGHDVKVGIVDTGIDLTHPCFDDAGYPSTTQLGDRNFTNNKVIVARVFANKAARAGFSAEAIQDHGTHVSGTVACNANTPASVNGAAIPYAPSGVAPGALLGNYNVFPGDITNARSEDILNALQAAAEDGMDVINMSLGGDAHGVQDLLTKAVDNLDRANIVVAVSAGNSGPGHFTVGSPGSAERALTAGASSVGHFVGIPVFAGTSTAGTQIAVTATGDFAIPTTNPVSGTLVGVSGTSAVPGLGNGCAPGGYGSAPAGFVALVARGTCSFGTKIQNAQDAGAAAAIVVNNVPGDPTSMGGDGVNHPTIVGVMAGLSDANALKTQIGQPVTIGNTPSYTDTNNDNIMAGFSSQGPTDVDYRVKPDLVAPGVNVLSSIPQAACVPLPAEGCWAFFQGTSMASPHLAGTAAVVRQAHPDWSAEQIRSAITNTAKQQTLTKSSAITTLETDPQIIGAGLDDVDAALGAKVALSSVSTSFGSSPSGTGKALSKTLTVTNLTGAQLVLPITVTGDPTFSASSASLTVPGNGTATLTITFAPRKSTAKGDHSATLSLGDVAHSVLYGFLK